MPATQKPNYVTNNGHRAALELLRRSLPVIEAAARVADEQECVAARGRGTDRGGGSECAEWGLRARDRLALAKEIRVALGMPKA